MNIISEKKIKKTNHYYGFVNMPNHWVDDNDIVYEDSFFDDKDYEDFYFDNFFDMDKMFGHPNSLFGTRGLPVGHPKRSSKSFDFYNDKYGPAVVRTLKNNDLQEQISRIQSMMGLINENRIEHLYQPDGISCGPTCLKMILNHIQTNDVTIEDIKKIVGTNNIKGTTLDDMIVGLENLNIKYEYPKLENKETAIKYLNNSIKNNNPIILRTLTQGIKHWVIVDDFDGEYYSVEDPWLGEIQYNEEEIIVIWEPRDFDCLKILKTKLTNNAGEFIVRLYDEKDKEQIMSTMVKSFSHLMSEDSLIKYTEEVTNFSKSIVVELDGEIVGFYLLGDRQIEKGINDNKCDKIYIDLDEYNKKTGLEGVALVVKDEYRGSGIGSKLKDYVKNLNIDYVWGLQYKSLNNLDMWLKRRKLAAENDELYVTVQELN